MNGRVPSVLVSRQKARFSCRRLEIMLSDSTGGLSEKALMMSGLAMCNRV